MRKKKANVVLCKIVFFLRIVTVFGISSLRVYLQWPALAPVAGLNLRPDMPRKDLFSSRPRAAVPMDERERQKQLWLEC